MKKIEKLDNNLTMGQLSELVHDKPNVIMAFIRIKDLAGIGLWMHDYCMSINIMDINIEKNTALIIDNSKGPTIVELNHLITALKDVPNQKMFLIELIS